MKRLQRVAWILILIVDVGYIAWGAGAAASPDRLLGPGGQAILPAGYEGYSGGSWSELSSASPVIAGYMTLLFRMYGLYCVLFGFMASVIALTAFRRGERWAWWVLLVGNTGLLALSTDGGRTLELHWSPASKGFAQVIEADGRLLTVGEAGVGVVDPAWLGTERDSSRAGTEGDSPRSGTVP